jgi:hypothetical protein
VGEVSEPRAEGEGVLAFTPRLGVAKKVGGRVKRGEEEGERVKEPRGEGVREAPAGGEGVVRGERERVGAREEEDCVEGEVEGERVTVRRALVERRGEALRVARIGDLEAAGQALGDALVLGERLALPTPAPLLALGAALAVRAPLALARTEREGEGLGEALGAAEGELRQMRTTMAPSPPLIKAGFLPPSPTLPPG